MSDRETLLSFGFETARVDHALKATKNTGLQPALDWLEAHQDDAVEVAQEADEEPSAGSGAADLEAKSLKCLDCGKIFRNTALASYHGEKSGHENFEESTEEVKPLTEDEKKERLAELKSKMDAKRHVKAKEDAEAAKREEALRRKGGKDMGKLREEMQLKEAEKAAALRKKEAQADKEAKLRVKAQIEADKQARAEKAAAEKAKREGFASPSASAPSRPSAALVAAQSGPKPSSAKYAETRLQLRMPTGSPLVVTLKSEQMLCEVIEWLVEQPQAAGIHRDAIRLSTTFPRRQFSGAELSQSLDTLGLAPSSVLAVVIS